MAKLRNEFRSDDELLEGTMQLRDIIDLEMMYGDDAEAIDFDDDEDTVDDLVFKMVNQGYKSDFEKTKDKIEKSMPQKDLLKENENIGDLKKYLMQLNNIKVNYRQPRD